MAKLVFQKRVEREVRGETFVFYVYWDARMQHVVGNGDEDATGKPDAADGSDFVLNDQIRKLFARGKITPGEFKRPA